MPATIAAAALPPSASTAVAANWAAPANTIADITTGATCPMTGSATTPKEMPSSRPAAPSGKPARMPGPR